MKTMIDTSIFYGIIEFTDAIGNEYRCERRCIYRRLPDDNAFTMIGYFDAKNYGLANPYSILRNVRECDL